MFSKKIGLLAAVISALALFWAPAGQASTVTVGSVLPLTFTPGTFEQVETRFNIALPEKGANLASPVTGTIVRWRMQGASGGPYYLRVLTPNGKGAYEATATSGPATPVGSGLQTFTAHIPIKSGDLIGVDPTSPTDGIGIAAVPGASYGFIFPPPFDGATVAPSGTGSGEEIELNAEVQPAPYVTSISPRSGPIGGGTEVTITGENFTGTSAVKFGTEPATDFNVESDTQVTATSPRGAAVGAVDVTVENIAGTSATGKPTTRFSYQACVVPKLKGKKLSVARAILGRTSCKLGKVKGHRGPGSKIVKQSPGTGKVTAPGSKISVTLG
jgi:hypothetical protein